MSLWWLALPILLLPIWWHRQKRESVQAVPLATARFLPAADPRQGRVALATSGARPVAITDLSRWPAAE